MQGVSDRLESSRSGSGSKPTQTTCGSHKGVVLSRDPLFIVTWAVQALRLQRLAGIVTEAKGTWSDSFREVRYLVLDQSVTETVSAPMMDNLYVAIATLFMHVSAWSRHHYIQLRALCCHVSLVASMHACICNRSSG